MGPEMRAVRANGILHSGIPWLQLDLAFESEEALAEARQVASLCVSHRSNGRGWKSICLHGISPVHTENPEKYGFVEATAPYVWTEIAEACPIATAFIKTIPFQQFYRVRFMLLEPGGYIQPHSDYPQKGLHAINVALNNPDGCYFKMEGYGNVPFRPGRAFLTDTSNVHCLINLSEEPRFHMIIDGRRDENDPELVSLICRSYDLTWGRCAASFPI